MKPECIFSDPANERDAVELLRAIVQQDSSNPPGLTVGVADIALTWLKAAGFSPEIIQAVPDKPNVVVDLENGPGPHLVLNAHLDTIPPGNKKMWRHPIHDLTATDGRLYGLGTGNMKAATVAMMFAVKALAAKRDQWSGRLTLTLVSDECVFGPDGAAHLLQARPDFKGDMLICGEGPGRMNLAIAEKGLMWVRLTASGPVAQGMLTTRSSVATTRLALALTEIDKWNDWSVPCPIAELDHAENLQGMCPSVNVGNIGGGGMISQAASHAQAEIDIRIPPGLSMETVSAEFDRLCAGDNLSWELIKGWDANWSGSDTPPALAIIAAARKFGRHNIKPVTRLPASDASRWRALGVFAVCYGPQPELASGANDYVNRRDFLDCANIYTHAALHLLAPQTAE